MPTIHILSEDEARKIAAGEVVERPASVTKELIENALDAGATDIQIIIQDGGRVRIQVIDNGIGMSSEDAHLSIAQHATSKIQSVDQLTSITTFGFRGEALSSISAVSNFTLVTRRNQDTHGYEISLSPGGPVTGKPAAANVGTTVTVDTLFCNVPARQKFLKQRETEWRSIHQLVYAYALVFPGIRFTLVHEQHTSFTTTPCSSMKERVAQIADISLLQHLLPLHIRHERQNIALEGVISNHQYSRYDRRNLFLFVNKRWIKNHALSKALLNGYQKVLKPQQYPFAAIALTIPSEEVDVNIHPRKEEVLLLHPYRIYTLVETAVQQALNTHISNLVQPAMVYYQNNRSQPTPSLSTDMLPAHESFTPQNPSPTFPLAVQYTEQPTQEISGPAYRTPDNLTSMNQVVSLQIPLAQTPAYELKGHYAYTYILLETTHGLLVLDQHAAHECVQYQNLVNTNFEATTTTLLFPILLSLSADEYVWIIGHQTTLLTLGISIEPWSNHQLRITGTAPYLQNQPIEHLIRTLLATRTEGSTLSPDALLHTFRAKIACITAIKAGDSLHDSEIHHLVKQYFTTQNRLTCPHGRPTSWLITNYDFEKIFKRYV